MIDVRTTFHSSSGKSDCMILLVPLSSFTLTTEFPSLQISLAGVVAEVVAEVVVLSSESRHDNLHPIFYDIIHIQ